MVAAYAPQAGSRYAGTFLVIAGTQSNVPAVITYSQNNILGNSKRAFTSALVIGFGGIGGIVASSESSSPVDQNFKKARLDADGIYLSPVAVYRQADFPRYVPGLWTTVGLNLMTLVFCLVMTFYFKKRNQALDEGRSLNEGSDKFKYTL
jgi:hypothetical protein